MRLGENIAKNASSIQFSNKKSDREAASRQQCEHSHTLLYKTTQHCSAETAMIECSWQKIAEGEVMDSPSAWFLDCHLDQTAHQVRCHEHRWQRATANAFTYLTTHDVCTPPLVLSVSVRTEPPPPGASDNSWLVNSRIVCRLIVSLDPFIMTSRGLSRICLFFMVDIPV
jgi:hypothetical protein